MPATALYVMLLQDMNNFYAQYKYIKPYLQKKSIKEDDIGKKSFLQSPEDRAKLVIWIKMLVLCHCSVLIICL